MRTGGSSARGCAVVWHACATAMRKGSGPGGVIRPERGPCRKDCSVFRDPSCLRAFTRGGASGSDEASAGVVCSRRRCTSERSAFPDRPTRPRNPQIAESRVCLHTRLRATRSRAGVCGARHRCATVVKSRRWRVDVQVGSPKVCLSAVGAGRFSDAQVRHHKALATRKTTSAEDLCRDVAKCGRVYAD